MFVCSSSFFLVYYRSIRSGLGIGRDSKSNDSDSGAKKPDHDIPKNNHTKFECSELYSVFSIT